MSPWWAALLPPLDPTPPTTDVQQRLLNWALQYTPRVALLEESVVMEVAASLRLFGGRQALRDRVVLEATELGCGGIGWASNSLAALCLARSGIENDDNAQLTGLLNGLKLDILTAARKHRVTLGQIGCSRLGDLRRLPRGGLNHRFDKQLLIALDQAYGHLEMAHHWVQPSEEFHARLELMSRVELAPALLAGAHILLLQLCGWLTARHAGVTAFTFGWAHDTMRAKHVEATGSLTIRTAIPSRNIDHLERLLTEHLAKVELAAPAGEVMLTAAEVVQLEQQNLSFFPDVVNRGQARALLRERIAARIGSENVQRPVLREDYRTEWTQHWLPLDQQPPRRKAATPPFPAPTCVLDAPLPLAVHNSRPHFQGQLKLLLGPHLVEGGWWHRRGPREQQEHTHVRRDYWLAHSPHGGFVWVFKEQRQTQDHWFLHGSFS